MEGPAGDVEGLPGAHRQAAQDRVEVLRHKGPVEPVPVDAAFDADQGGGAGGWGVPTCSTPLARDTGGTQCLTVAGEPLGGGPDAGFIGTSNVISGHLTAVEAGSGVIDFGDGQRITVPLPGGAGPGTALELTVRPVAALADP